MQLLPGTFRKPKSMMPRNAASRKKGGQNFVGPERAGGVADIFHEGPASFVPNWNEW